jgi:MOSC domain-containing protein YiiM
VAVAQGFHTAHDSTREAATDPGLAVTLSKMADSAPARLGVVAEINIAPRQEELPTPVQRVNAVAGRGLEGDRNFLSKGDPQPRRDADLTLIASEALDALAEDTGLALTAAESRRNVLTRGVDVNALVGRRFRIGGAECEGIELCEPCRHLEGLTYPGVLRGLVHRGGLRAAIVEGGEISVGDAVVPA